MAFSKIGSLACLSLRYDIIGVFCGCWCQDVVRRIDQQNDHLKSECQQALDQLNVHASVGTNSQSSNCAAAVSANEDTCVQPSDEQTSD